MVAWSVFSAAAEARGLLPASRMFHALQRAPPPVHGALSLKINMGRMRPMQGWAKKVFRPEYVRKYYGVTPIIALMSFWAVGLVGYSCYALATRDVVYDKTKKPGWLRMDLMNPHSVKLWTINEVYRPMKKLDRLYRAMDGEDVEEEEDDEEEN